MDFKQWIETNAKNTFMYLTAFQAFFLLCIFIADVITNLQNSQSSLDDYYKWSILFFFQISEGYYVYSAVFLIYYSKIYKANVLELFAFILIEFVTFGAASVRFISLKQSQTIETVFDYIYLGYAFALLILSIVCYKPFYDVFFYRNIMKVGASLESQKIYRNYKNFDVIITLYFQISLSTFITYFFFFDTLDWWYYLLDVIIIGMQVTAFIFGLKGLQQEIQCHLYCYFSLICTAQLYMICKTILIIITSSNTDNQDSQNFDIYTLLIIGITNLTCVVLLIFDFFYAFKCMQGFGQGLKQILHASFVEKSQEMEESNTRSYDQ